MTNEVERPSLPPSCYVAVTETELLWKVVESLPYGGTLVSHGNLGSHNDGNEPHFDNRPPSVQGCHTERNVAVWGCRGWLHGQHS